jgi:hypothetical protein
VPEAAFANGRGPTSPRAALSAIAFLLIAAMSVSLSAAVISRNDAPPSLGARGAATLIYRYQLRHCAVTEVMVRSSRVGAALFVTADGWLRHTLLTDPAFSHLGRVSAGSTQSGTLGYLLHGHEMTVDWAEFRVPGDSASGRLSLRACMSLPEDIEIWGTSLYGGGQMARVLYSETRTGSPLEVLIRHSGVFRDDIPWWPSAAGENVAAFVRGVDGRWSVAAISDGP